MPGEQACLLLNRAGTVKARVLCASLLPALSEDSGYVFISRKAQSTAAGERSTTDSSMGFSPH